MPPRKENPKHKIDVAEYRFVIDAYSPDTIPMARLAQYMTELSQILGEQSAVHFRRLEKGSTALVSRIDREAAPKVRQRVVSLRRGDAPKDIQTAYVRINELLRADNASGILKDDKPARAVVVRFPGREEVIEDFPVIRQHGSIDGIVTGIRGKDETIHITLQSEGRQISGCQTNKTLAKQLGTKLFEPVRLFGRGKWTRDAEGSWCLADFRVESFESLDDTPLSDALASLRTINSNWDEDAYQELIAMRHGPGEKRNGGH